MATFGETKTTLWDSIKNSGKVFAQGAGKQAQYMRDREEELLSKPDLNLDEKRELEQMRARSSIIDSNTDVDLRQRALEPFSSDELNMYNAKKAIDSRYAPQKSPEKLDDWVNKGILETFHKIIIENGANSKEARDFTHLYSNQLASTAQGNALLEEVRSSEIGGDVLNKVKETSASIPGWFGKNVLGKKMSSEVATKIVNDVDNLKKGVFATEGGKNKAQKVHLDDTQREELNSLNPSYLEAKAVLENEQKVKEALIKNPNLIKEEIGKFKNKINLLSPLQF